MNDAKCLWGDTFPWFLLPEDIHRYDPSNTPKAVEERISSDACMRFIKSKYVVCDGNHRQDCCASCGKPGAAPAPDPQSPPESFNNDANDGNGLLSPSQGHSSFQNYGSGYSGTFNDFPQGHSSFPDLFGSNVISSGNQQGHSSLKNFNFGSNGIRQGGSRLRNNPLGPNDFRKRQKDRGQSR